MNQRTTIGILSLALSIVSPAVTGRTEARLRTPGPALRGAAAPRAVALPAPKWENVAPEMDLAVGRLEPWPANPNEMFALAAGALYRTRDQGENWTLLSEFGPPDPVDVAVDPTDDRNVYLLFSGPDGHEFRVWRSSDGGVSWVVLPPVPSRGVKIEVDPRAPNLLLVAGEVFGTDPVDPTVNSSALFMSRDRGRTWTSRVAGSFGSATGGWPASMAMCFSAPDFIYLMGWGDDLNGSVLRTTDQGSTWTDVTGPLHIPIGIWVDDVNPWRVFVEDCDPNGPVYSIFASLDGGTTWTRTILPEAYTALLLPPGQPAAVEAGGSTYDRSFDNGLTWATLATLPGEPGDLKIAGTTRFAAIDGVYRSVDGGYTWLPSLRVKTRRVNVWAACVSPASPLRIFARAGTSWAVSDDAGASWSLRTADVWPRRLWADGSNPDRLLALTRNEELMRSGDAGRTWTNIAPPSWPQDAAPVGGDLDRLVAVAKVGWTSVTCFRTEDGGRNWTSSLIENGYYDRFKVAVDRVAPSRMYAGATGSPTMTSPAGDWVFRSADSGATWTRVPLPSGSIGIRCLESHPAREGVAFAGTGKGLFRTVDGGTTWSKVAPFDVSVLMASPRAPQWIFAGGADGVFVSVNGGAAWSSLNQGLGCLLVQGLDLDAVNSRLYVATARGLWRTTLGGGAAMATISGTVRTADGTPLSGVSLTCSGNAGEATTGADGAYSLGVVLGWTGTITPAKSGYDFTPASRSYENVVSNQVGQDYTASPVGGALTISGRVTTASGAGVRGVFMLGLPGNPVTDAGGAFQAPLPSGWTGTIVPVERGLTFVPSARTYQSPITATLTGQNFSARAGVSFPSSACSRLVFPDALWADSRGGAGWKSELRITDVTGGSRVSAFFYYGGGQRRGPIVLWRGRRPGSTCVIPDLAAALQARDRGFSFKGRFGALVIATQGSGRRIAASLRTSNAAGGRFSAGMPDGTSFQASMGMDLAVKGFSGAGFGQVGVFNPGMEPATAEFTMMGEDGNAAGSPFSMSFGGAESLSFDPFAEAGASGGAVGWLRVRVKSGAGRLMVSGAAFSSSGGEPSELLARPLWPGWAMSPGSTQIVPMAAWVPAGSAPARTCELQVTDLTGGSDISVSFFAPGGVARGPFALWTGGRAGSGRTFANILETLKGLDPGFDYQGRTGVVVLGTAGEGERILASARLRVGTFSAGAPAGTGTEEHTAAVGRDMLLPGLRNDAAGRSSVCAFNPSDQPVTVTFRVVRKTGFVAGTFRKRFPARGTMVFDPFAEAGARVAAKAFDDAGLVVHPTRGAGRLVALGMTVAATGDAAAIRAIPVK